MLASSASSPILLAFNPISNKEIKTLKDNFFFLEKAVCPTSEPRDFSIRSLDHIAAPGLKTKSREPCFFLLKRAIVMIFRTKPSILSPFVGQRKLHVSNLLVSISGFPWVSRVPFFAFQNCRINNPPL